MSKTALVLGVLTALLVSAANAAEPVCVSRVVILEPFAMAFDQHQALSRLALEHGPGNVQTAVAQKTPGISKRFLVFALACDAFFVPRRLANQAVIIPDDSPYEWTTAATAAAATAEYEAHGEAGARGIVTIGDGSFVVYWSRLLVAGDQD